MFSRRLMVKPSGLRVGMRYSSTFSTRRFTSGSLGYSAHKRSASTSSSCLPGRGVGGASGLLPEVVAAGVRESTPSQLFIFGWVQVTRPRGCCGTHAAFKMAAAGEGCVMGGTHAPGLDGRTCGAPHCGLMHVTCLR